MVVITTEIINATMNVFKVKSSLTFFPKKNANAKMITQQYKKGI